MLLILFAFGEAPSLYLIQSYDNIIIYANFYDIIFKKNRKKFTRPDEGATGR